MLITYFYPFDRPDLTDYMEAEFQFQRKKNNVVIHIIKGSKDKDESFRFLSQNDRVYIIAHGNTSVIGARRIGGKELNAFELARILVKKKLPRDFVDLRILSCDSAVSDKDNPAFAERLKKYMKDFGYHQLMVTGYLGKTVLQRDWRLKNIEEVSFWATPKKGIKPHENYINLIKSPLGCDKSLYYAASDFKRTF
ncbi:hypothetical protein ACFLJF_005375 [Salmonella enterica]